MGIILKLGILILSGSFIAFIGHSFLSQDLTAGRSFHFVRPQPLIANGANIEQQIKDLLNQTRMVLNSLMTRSDKAEEMKTDVQEFIKLMTSSHVNLLSPTNDTLKFTEEEWRAKQKNQAYLNNKETLKTIGVGQYNNYSLMPVKESLNESTEVLILLFVRNDGWYKRELVRHTIGKINKYLGIKHKYQLAFVYGTGLEPTEKQLSDWKNETILFHDSILLNTEDSYSTVIFKEISGFKWALEAHQSHNGKSQLKWIIKMDDDVIYEPYALDNLLEKHSQEASTPLIICRGIFSVKPLRNPKSKWYIPKFVYQKDTFPSYCYGPSYILSLPAVEVITDLFEKNYHTDFIWLEDVMLTGILAQMGNITKVESRSTKLLKSPKSVAKLKSAISYHMSGSTVENIQEFYKANILPIIEEKSAKLEIKI